MNENTLTLILGPLITITAVAVGAVLAGWATWRNTRLNFVGTIESEKYKLRLTAYQSLWQATKGLRRTPEPIDLMRSSVRRIARQLDDWYFASGGLVLSENARASYFKLVEELSRHSTGPDPNISGADYENIYLLANGLRTRTSEEVGGRTGKAVIAQRQQ